MDISPNANLDSLFRPLDNGQMIDSTLEKEKAKLKKREHHASWLRIYAIKLAKGIYIITGGAIKLTETMQEREHTKKELGKVDKVRRFLINEGIVDTDGFVEYISEL